MFELKPISKDAIPAALRKAERYRLLNDPLGAESICRDILDVDPDNQEALKSLLLALTDQFEARLSANFEPARELLPRLATDYARTYYEGIIYERRAKAHMRRGGPGSGRVAYDWFRRAMECYERAIEQRPPEDDSAVLRWNACARTLMSHPELVPAPEETFRPLLE